MIFNTPPVAVSGLKGLGKMYISPSGYGVDVGVIVPVHVIVVVQVVVPVTVAVFVILPVNEGTGVFVHV